MRVVFVERENAPERLVCEAEIVFEAETWIRVYTDGVLKVDGLFPPGTTAKAQADERILIHTGNAGGFSFLLNGKAAKPLGRSGQVITDIKITPDNFKDFLEAESPARPTAPRVNTGPLPESRSPENRLGCPSARGSRTCRALRG